MNLSSLFPLARRTSRWLKPVASAIACGCLLPGSARAAYDGPVQAPGDPFGGPGAYAVITETFPSPDWPEQVVTVLRPDGAAGRRPVWFFAHGFGGSDPALYRELLAHLASHGAVVVFSPYPASLLDVAGNYAALFDGFTAAVERYPDRIDTSRVGFAGHSYGGGAVPALALRATRERGWGGDGLALLLLAPWYSYFVSDADLASFPARTQAVVQVYEDDGMNDHRMAIDVFTHLNLPVGDKDYLMIRSDRIEGYKYSANHRVPTGAGAPGADARFNALDAWGVLRIAQALSASALEGDAAARAVALGNGAAGQTQMGVTATGRGLRRMEETDTPVPLFPSTRYLQGWDRPLNPRRGATLPEIVTRPRLTNLSARARSGAGDDVLIVGAAVAGARPKSLLVRAVGPGLVNAGVAGVMANPRLTTYRGTAVDLDLDDWSETPEPDALRAAMAETGAFALAEGSKDAAILASFAAGNLTVHATASDGVAGVVLLELYDAEDDASAVLDNLSARGRVGGGDDVMIAGFVVSGPVAMRVLVRGIGPGLVGYGVADALRDPMLEIYRGDELIAVNDNWSANPAELAAAAEKVGAFPLAAGSADAGVLLALPAGAYTAHLRAADGAAGIGLVEVYAVP